MTGEIWLFILTFILVPDFSFAVLSPQSIICSELGPTLEHLTSPGFEHISQQPQCVDQILPSFTLYTRNNPEIGCDLIQMVFNTNSSIEDPNYYSLSSSCSEFIKNTKKVVFVVHGFQMYKSSHLLEYEKIKDGILEQENVGVVVVDWYEGAKIDLSLIGTSSFSSLLKDFINFEPYHQAASNTRYMGTALARVIENIRNATHLPAANNEIQPYNKTNTNTKNKDVKVKSVDEDGSGSQIFFHCIGHSLGAHVCGFAGKALRKISAKPMDRISGLDPAGPLFVKSGIAANLQINDSPKVHLSSGDADFVDTIHTDSTWLGSFTKMGHYDFYLGESQKNVTKFGYEQPAAKDCFQGSHSLSKDYFLATISNECEVEEVCSNINVNKMDGCHDAIGVGIKMGYQTTPSATYENGYFPVHTDRQGLSCSNKKIKVEAEEVPPPVLKELLGLKDVCSIVRGLIPSIGKGIIDVISKWEKALQSIEETKVELDIKMKQMFGIVSMIDAQNEPLRIAYTELNKIDVLYLKEKSILEGLAKRTVRRTSRLILMLKKVQDANVEIDGANIKSIMSNIKRLLDESTVKLSEASKNLEIIQDKYITINSNLDLTKIAIKNYAKMGENLIRDITNTSIEMKKDEISTWSDWVTGVGGFAKIVFGAIKVAQDGEITLSDILEAGMIISGTKDIAGEVIEVRKEKSQLEEMRKTAAKMKKVLNEEMKSINEEMLKVNKQVDNQLNDIKGRVAIVREWSDSVDIIREDYGVEDYIDLEMAMRNELSNQEVEWIIDDFTDLKKVANTYLKLPK